eukprot:2762689-Karenia_brevis.AAC.1
MQGLVRIDRQDVVVIRADDKHAPHRLRFEPIATARLQLRRDEITARASQWAASSSRTLDTSNWLG